MPCAIVADLVRLGGIWQQQGRAAHQGERLHLHQGRCHGLASPHHRGLLQELRAASAGGHLQPPNAERLGHAETAPCISLRHWQGPRLSTARSSAYQGHEWTSLPSADEPCLPGALPRGLALPPSPPPSPPTSLFVRVPFAAPIATVTADAPPTVNVLTTAAAAAATITATTTAATNPSNPSAAAEIRELKRKLNLAQQETAAAKQKLREKEVAEQRGRRRDPVAAENAELRLKLEELEHERQELLRAKRWGVGMAGVKQEAEDVKAKLVKVQAEQAAAKAGQAHARSRVDNLRNTLKAATSTERDAVESVKKELNQLRKELRETTAAAEVKYNNLVRERDSAMQVALQERDKAVGEVRRLLDVAVRERDALVRERDAAVQERDAAVRERDEFESALQQAQNGVAQLQMELKLAADELRVATRKKCGRKAGHAGRALLEKRWDEMTPTARRMAMLRHTHDIANHLELAAADWEPHAFAAALNWLDLLPDLLETRPFVKVRMDFAQDMLNILDAEWSVELALYLKTELSLSNRNYDKARLSTCKVYIPGKGRAARKLYTDPLTCQTLKFPQPLKSRHAWFSQWRSYVAKHELTCDSDGKVAERSYTDLLTLMLEREFTLDTIVTTTTASQPWRPAFHIDATSTSSRRSFTHAGITLGALYKDRSHVQSELKLMTLSVGQVKDNAPGLRLMLGDGVGKGIGAEIVQLQVESVIAIDVFIDGEEWCLVQHCQPVGCVDLAAARGLRVCRGKEACLCGCHGAAMLQAYPGDGLLPAIPAGDSIAVWEEALSTLRSFCSYATDLMSYGSLRAAGHVPPDDWDFTTGAWRCCHCGDEVWYSVEEYKKAVQRLAALAARAADDEEAAKKELSQLLSTHAKTHIGATYLSAPVIRVGTDFLIVDGMHCLQLNVAKTAWKYSIGDRMEEHHRIRVAKYLDAINCPLDIRAKGQRNPEQKWFSASSFDQFVCGKQASEASQSPGLATNIWAIIERIYDQPPAQSAASPPPTAAQAPAPSRPAPSRSRRKRAAPEAGFGQIDSAEQEPGCGEHLVLHGLGGRESILSAQEEELKEFVRTRFGNRGSEVLDTMRLWEAYAELHAAWRDPWTDDSKATRAKRALRFLRAAIAFTKELNKVSNFKHKSWYVHVIVFVVPQQIAKHGDTWVYSTMAIESRGARLKRYGRSTVSWRKAVNGWSSFDYTNRASGAKVQRTQRYMSSA
eukprot:6214393-Pleurochrysis_carterae.AAC.3